MHPRIFVSVAAYADPHLEYTLKNALRQAAHPEALVFGVLNQTTNRLSDKTMLQQFPVRLIQITPPESYGAAWARSVIQTLYDNERYFLQIDSHMVFERGWDTHLIDTLEKLPPKSIISAYPYGYSRVVEKIIFDCEVSTETTLVIRPMPDQILTPENPVLHFHSCHLPERRPVLGSHIAGGFLFTTGDFLQEVPYDPQWYFHGEEQGLTLRAFTHGWDIYHIPNIPLYHLYKSANIDHTGHHWHKKWQRSSQQVAHLDDRARRRLSDLIAGRLQGVYGLGGARSLADFAIRSGINYRDCTITEPANLAGRLL